MEFKTILIQLDLFLLFFGYTYKECMSETDIKLFEKITSNYGKDVFLSYLNIFNELMDEIFDKKVVRNLNFHKITYLKNVS